MIHLSETRLSSLLSQSRSVRKLLDDFEADLGTNHAITEHAVATFSTAGDQFTALATNVATADHENH